MKLFSAAIAIFLFSVGLWSEQFPKKINTILHVDQLVIWFKSRFLEFIIIFPAICDTNMLKKRT